MEKKAFSGIMLAILLSMSTLIFYIQIVITEPTTIIVPDNYPTIQEAINAANPRDTVYVKNGTYPERVNINKSVSIFGEGRSITSINGSISITASNVVVGEFTIQGRVDIGEPKNVAKNVIVNGNIISKGGIFVYASLPFPYLLPVFTNNIIMNNIISNSTCGIHMLGWGTNNTLGGNRVINNDVGVVLEGQGGNTIVNNVLSDNVFGMWLSSSHNLLRNNTLANNQYNFIMGISYYDRLLINDVDTSNTVNGKPIYFLINKSNMVIDPSSGDVGYLALLNCYNLTMQNLNLSNNGQGMVISESANITIIGSNLKNNMVALSATYVNRTTFENNTITGNLHGVSFNAGFNSVIVNNMFRNNTLRQLPYDWAKKWPPRPIRYWITDELIWYSGGIFLDRLRNSTIANNIFLNNERGIYVRLSSFNTFKNNTMAGNVYNFGIDPTPLFPPEWYINPPPKPQISPYLMNDIDTSNTVNNKPIYYWINHNNEQVPSDAGCLILVNSTNIIVKDLMLQNNTEGVLLFDTTNTVISNNIITGTRYGVLTRGYMFRGRPVNNRIIENNITNNGVGIELRVGVNNKVSHNLLKHNLAGIVAFQGSNTIVGNMIMNNTFLPMNEWILGYWPPHGVPYVFYDHRGAVGIILESSNNIICGNTIQSNDYGMSIGLLTRKSGNKIYHNNFIDPVIEHLEHWAPYVISYNIWDEGYPSGGNYWSDYTDVDLFGGPYQNVTGSDGIWDHPYVIYANNQDNYPLIRPWTSSPVEAIQELVETIETWNLHKGTENSLTSKLDNVIHLLNKGNKNGATHKLTGFVNQVEALEDKKLTFEQANYLISEAQKIINLVKE